MGSRFLNLALIVFFVGAASPKALSFETGAGLISLEEGDDRHRPGVMASISHGAFESMVYYCARSFGPVMERTVLVTASGLFPLPLSRHLFALTGLSVLNESTSITYAINDRDHDQSESRYNIGLVLGLRVRFDLSRTWFFHLGWDSALFPAGIAGGLFLATGRKQVLFTGVGIRW